MKKMLIVLLCLTGLIAGDIDLWKKSTLNQILQKGELRVGMEPGYMPFEMKNTRGDIIGFDVDMAKALAKSMGVKLKIVPTAWDGIIGGLITGKYDLIMSGMTLTQARNLKVNFADPYFIVGQTVLVRNEVARNVSNVKALDRSKYTIATKLGVTGEIATRKFFKKAKIVTYESEADAAAAVLSGKADAMVYDQPYNTVFMGQKGKGRLTHWDKPLTYEPLAWAIRKGDPDFLNYLNNFLRQIKEDKIEDKYNKLYRKWFVDTRWLRYVN